MNLLYNISRVLIYSILTFVFISFEFYALGEFCFWVLNKLYDYYKSMNAILFYFLFMSFGLLIIRFMYLILLNISQIIIKFLTRITPYAKYSIKYSVWYTRIVSLICCCLFIYSVFSDVASLFIGVICTVMSIMAVLMAHINIHATKELLYIRMVSKGLGISEREARETLQENQ